MRVGSILSKLFKRSMGIRYPGSRPWERDDVSPYIDCCEPTVLSATGALRLAEVWRAVNILSKDVAKIPIDVYRTDGKRRAVDRMHSAHRLIKRQVNEYTNSHDFIRTVTSHALLYGNGYALITDDQRGARQRMFVLNPTQVVPVVEELSYPGVFMMPGLTFWYMYYLPEGRMVRYKASEVFHLKGVSYNGLEGWSVLSQAAESFGLTEAARNYGTEFFRNNARPNVVLHHPSRLSDQAKANLKRSWAEQYSGTSNAHKTAILQEGMQLTTLSINAKDAMLLETRGFQTKDVANWFGIPAHLLGDSEKVSYNSLEQENLSYLTQSLDHWLVAWERECNMKLLTPGQKQAESHYFEFDRSALVRADIKSRTEAYSKAVNDGWMSRNEVREKENMNPIPGEIGDQYGPIQKEKPQEEKPQEGGGEDQSRAVVNVTMRMAFTDSLQRVTQNIHQSVRKVKPASLESEYGDRLDRALRPLLIGYGAHNHLDAEALVARAKQRYFEKLKPVVTNGLKAEQFALELADEIMTND